MFSLEGVSILDAMHMRIYLLYIYYLDIYLLTTQATQAGREHQLKLRR